MSLDFKIEQELKPEAEIAKGILEIKILKDENPDVFNQNIDSIHKLNKNYNDVVFSEYKQTGLSHLAKALKEHPSNLINLDNLIAVEETKEDKAKQEAYQKAKQEEKKKYIQNLKDQFVNEITLYEIKKIFNQYTESDFKKLSELETNELLTGCTESKLLKQFEQKNNQAKLAFLVENKILKTEIIKGSVDLSATLRTSNNELLNKHLYNWNKEKYGKPIELNTKAGSAYLTVESQRPQDEFITLRHQAILDLIINILTSKTGKSIKELSNESPFKTAIQIRVETLAKQITNNKKPSIALLNEIIDVLDDMKGKSVKIEFIAEYKPKEGNETNESYFREKHNLFEGLVIVPKENGIAKLRKAYINLYEPPLTGVVASVEGHVINLPSIYRTVPGLTTNLENYLLNKVIFNRISAAYDSYFKNLKYKKKVKNKEQTTNEIKPTEPWNQTTNINTDYILKVLGCENPTDRKLRTLQDSIKKIFDFYKEGSKDNHDVKPLLKNWMYRYKNGYTNKKRREKILGYGFKIIKTKESVEAMMKIKHGEISVKYPIDIEF